MAEFEEQARDGVGVVRVTGEIDMASAPEFLERVLACLARFDSIEVDLAGVTFMDSSGIGVLVRMRTEAEILGKPAGLVNVRPSTARLLELTGLQGLFDVELPRG
jgi:anti-sigma B factor antagonist